MNDLIVALVNFQDLLKDLDKATGPINKALDEAFDKYNNMTNLSDEDERIYITLQEIEEYLCDMPGFGIDQLERLQHFLEESL